MPDPRLEAAYRATDYRAGPITIRIGEIAPIDADSWAFITACNPGSKPLPTAENGQRMARLESDVRAAGFELWHGEAVSRDGSWPEEPSLLVLDIDEATACGLGRRFGQAAIVFADRAKAARLIWLDDSVRSSRA
jgi:hypothetical protein